MLLPPKLRDEQPRARGLTQDGEKDQGDFPVEVMPALGLKG